MSSYAYGKGEVCDWVRVRFPTVATVLDVGACDGNWRRLIAAGVWAAALPPGGAKARCGRPIPVR